MASGGKRGAGDRVLESKHVIGLFLLMLLFSGAFFALGYVMARDQYDGRVRASFVAARNAEPTAAGNEETPPKKAVEAPRGASESDPATATNNSDWEFYGNSKPVKDEPRLEPVSKPTPPPASKAVPVSVKTKLEQPPAVSGPVKGGKGSLGAPLVPSGALVLQVAALTGQDDALSIAGSLQKKHYSAFVQTPQRDKFYRVQVGPFKDKKAASAAKKGLESEGFKAFYVTR